ncbi:hypothetical protein ACJMK2_030695 [Sinanodonta woodiana]|uniref:Cadherin domain-containing protein n=1 Tax=Sinanodonta woodiana TaxID=1069815 RepID=A0ABD3WZZ1_SINWO
MMHQRFHGSVVTILATVILFGHFAQSQQSWNKSFSIQENNVINVLVGFVYTSLPDAARPPYTFYSTSQKAFIEKYFTITLDSGEIRAKVMLDREENETYSFALLKNYDYIQITIRVTDVNDNSPKFSNDTKYLIIPENAPHYKITLGSAVDIDIGQNTIQSYLILSGNVDFAFNVSGRFSGTQVLLLDLGINGTLDYETTKSYTLIIRVYDGGTPRLYGDMTVYITIIDANDNQPIFNQSKYSAAVQENATIGQSIIEVFATDLDSGDNGKVSYIIDRQNSDPEAYFLIDEVTGIVTLQKRLDYELKTSYKLIVIARDNGSQPLQTSVLIDIEVLNINEQPAKIEVTFLTNQTGRVREDANVNDFVARISVSDPDASSDSNSSITVRLEGGEGYFGLIIRDRVVYLIVNQTLDRETKPWFNLTVVAVDSGTPPLFQSKNILLTIDDVNDNKPVFSSAVYLAEIEEMSSNGSSVVQVTATDRDIGENARVTYSINDDPDRHSDWFQIDTNSGLITTNGKIDCEVESKSQLIVVARDSGIPQMSSSATVLVSVLDINDKEPMFEHSQYSAAVPESRAVGSCILQVRLGSII